MSYRLGLACLVGVGWLGAQLPKDGIPGPCTADQALNYSGVWVKRIDNLLELSESGLLPPQRQSLLAKADQALEILKRAYPTPRGVDVWYARWAMNSHNKSLLVKLTAYFILMEARCYSEYRDTGQGRLVVEQNSDAWVMVDLNSLGQALRGELTDGYEVPSGAPIYWSPIEFGPDFRGYPTLKGTIETNTTTVFIGKEKRLPIRPVTREEILRIHANRWQKLKQDEMSRHEKELAREQKLLTELKQKPGETTEQFSEREARLRKNVALDEQRLTQARQDITGIPARIQGQIEAMTPDQRQSQAIIPPPSKHFYEDLKFGTGTNARALWAGDETSVASGTPRHSVQFLTVFWRRVPGSKAKEAALDEILRKLDFDALRALLDK